MALSLAWCLAFGVGVSAAAFLGGGGFIDAVTTSAEVRDVARHHLWLAALAPLVAALPFAFDGIYIGATWTRAMRDLMVVALLAYVALLAGIRMSGMGNAGLWLAFLGFLAFRGIGQALAYPALARRSFPTRPAAGLSPAGESA